MEILKLQLIKIAIHDILPLDTDNYPHAVVIHKIERSSYVIKNSYYRQKSMEIDKQLPVYDSFKQDPERFRQTYPMITDHDHIAYHRGNIFQFEAK